MNNKLFVIWVALFFLLCVLPFSLFGQEVLLEKQYDANALKGSNKFVATYDNRLVYLNSETESVDIVDTDLNVSSFPLTFRPSFNPTFLVTPNNHIFTYVRFFDELPRTVGTLLTMDGEVVWRLDNEEFLTSWEETSVSDPAIDSNGNIIFFNGTYLMSVSPDGEINWYQDDLPGGTSTFLERPTVLVDEQNRIYYVSTREIHAFSANGERLWVSRHEGEWATPHVAIGPSDTLVVNRMQSSGTSQVSLSFLSREDGKTLNRTRVGNGFPFSLTVSELGLVKTVYDEPFFANAIMQWSLDGKIRSSCDEGRKRSFDLAGENANQDNRCISVTGETLFLLADDQMMTYRIEGSGNSLRAFVIFHNSDFSENQRISLGTFAQADFIFHMINTSQMVARNEATNTLFLVDLGTELATVGWPVADGDIHGSNRLGAAYSTDVPPLPDEGDYDFDGLSNLEELTQTGTSPYLADSDLDGISDNYEIGTTEPLKFDDQSPFFISSENTGQLSLQHCSIGERLYAGTAGSLVEIDSEYDVQRIVEQGVSNLRMPSIINANGVLISRNQQNGKQTDQKSRFTYQALSSYPLELQSSNGQVIAATASGNTLFEEFVTNGEQRFTFYNTTLEKQWSLSKEDRNVEKPVIDSDENLYLVEGDFISGYSVEKYNSEGTLSFTYSLPSDVSISTESALTANDDYVMVYGNSGIESKHWLAVLNNDLTEQWRVQLSYANYSILRFQPIILTNEERIVVIYNTLEGENLAATQFPTDLVVVVETFDYSGHKLWEYKYKNAYISQVPSEIFTFITKEHSLFISGLRSQLDARLGAIEIDGSGQFKQEAFWEPAIPVSNLNIGTRFPVGTIPDKGWVTNLGNSSCANTNVAFKINNTDSDNDGLTNDDEFNLSSNPFNADSDQDGLNDFEEFNLGTRLDSADSDNDGLSDFDELKLYYTSALDNDTDADGVSDFDEITNGTDPHQSALIPLTAEYETRFEKSDNVVFDIRGNILQGRNKYNANGELIWTSELFEADSVGQLSALNISMVTAKNHYIFIAGSLSKSVVALNENNQFLWSYLTEFSEVQIAGADSEGNVYLFDTTPQTGRDLFVLKKISPSGSILWSSEGILDPLSDFFFSIDDSDNTVVLSSESFLLLSPGGELLAELPVNYGNPRPGEVKYSVQQILANSRFYGNKITASENGTISNQLGIYDFSGDLIWAQSDDIFRLQQDLVIDGEGNAYVSVLYNDNSGAILRIDSDGNSSTLINIEQPNTGHYILLSDNRLAFEYTDVSNNSRRSLVIVHRQSGERLDEIPLTDGYQLNAISPLGTITQKRFDRFIFSPSDLFIDSEATCPSTFLGCNARRDYLQKGITAFDRDGDGVPDSEDAFPMVAAESRDADRDGIGDNADIDDDNDGLSDDDEQLFGTNALIQDTDGDGLSDYDEVYTYGTDPTIADTDGDGVNDGDEVLAGTQPPLLKWTLDFSVEVGNSLALDKEGVIYLGGANGVIYAINPDKSIKWQLSTGSNINHGVSIDTDGRIFVGNDAGKVLALDSIDGSVLWEVVLESAVRASVAIHSGKIYAATSNGKLVSLNAQTGDVLWEYSAEGALFGSPAVDTNGIVYIGDYSGYLHAITPQGHLEWRTFLGSRIRGSIAIGTGVIYVGADDLNVYAYRTIDGAQLWSVRIGGSVISSPAIAADGTLYVTANNRKLHAIDDTGDVIWTLETDDFIWSSPTIGSDDIIYFGSRDGSFYAVKASGKLRWRYDVGEVNLSSAVIADDGTVYIGSRSEKLYAFNTHSNGLARSAWPKFGNDNQNTGSAVRENTKFDYDGDNIADVAIRRPSNGFQYIKRSSDNGIERIFFGSQSNDTPVSGDFDGDGISDIAVFRPTTGTWLIRQSSDNKIFRLVFGNQPNDIPVPADYDGDGITDIAIRRPSTGQFVVRKSSSPTSYLRATFGTQSTDIPTVADYDGDGKADIAIRRSSLRQFIYRRSSDDVIVRQYFGGQSEDIPVQADYDGDGITDIAVRRPSTGQWYIRYSSNKTIYRAFFGSQFDDVPVPADYDGDGKADIAVRRPNTGQWFMRYSSNNQILRLFFGSEPTDVPLAAPSFVVFDMTNRHANHNLSPKDTELPFSTVVTEGFAPVFEELSETEAVINDVTVIERATMWDNNEFGKLEVLNASQMIRFDTEH